MKKIRIAQIGTNGRSHANMVWGSLLKQTDVFEVVGYAFPEGERDKYPKKAEAYNGYREMTVEEILNDPTIDAVAVETDEIYLTKYSLMVAEAGKHLHMEKPGGTNLKDFEKLIETLRAKNLKFSTGYMYRFNPAVRAALEKIKSGEIGKVYAVEAHMDCIHNGETREWLSAFPGGMLFFLGCHLIDLIYTIQGEPDEIIPLNCSTGAAGVNGPDYGMVALKYPNGVSFAKSCAAEYGGYLRRQLVICAERGTIELKPFEVSAGDTRIYTVVNEAYTPGWNEPWKTSKTEILDRYDEMMHTFADAIMGKAELRSYDYELNLYKLILKCCGEKI